MDNEVGKNIVVCLDGTGNQLRARGNTNVVRLYQLLDLTDPVRQIAYYDPGVGTFSAPGAWTPWARWLSRTAGLALGSGLRANLAEAYTFLMHTWQPHDRIYIVGFSRGAYTARALAGVLHAAGLLRPGSENLVPYAVGVYARSKDWSADDWAQLHKFADVFCQDSSGGRSVPVEFLGLWDSVKAAGILRWNLKWLYTRQLPNVRTVRHAVSVDEKRRPYREYLVHPKAAAQPALDEVWFAGVHSDVGGTFDDDPRLPAITLRWMVQGAAAAGLRFSPEVADVVSAVAADHARGTVHRMGWIWALLTYRRRRIPPGARVHRSVQTRIAADPGYKIKLPPNVVWDDPDWPTPARTATEPTGATDSGAGGHG